MAEEDREFRIEEDTVGKIKVPAEAYYGVNALRCRENFHITGHGPDPVFTRALIQVKLACAKTNLAVGRLDEKAEKAIVKACERILDGEFMDQFITDAIQGGAGTSFNMNANEVICNVAIEELGGERGDYSILHPNDHVNMGQSTNDVIPTAGKMAMIRYFQALKQELESLIEALEQKGEEFDSFVKMGRTQLQDAVPIRLGQEFNAFAKVLKRDLDRMDLGIESLKEVNLGGTAIGTGLNADQDYVAQIVPCLAEIAEIDLVQADDLIDGTQNLDSFAFASSILKTLAVDLSKIANDLRLMSSGPLTGIGDIQLPARQAGSSIMPGKINPVIPEVVNQAAFATIGNDMTIGMAVEAGQLELNAFEPVIFYKMFESFKVLLGAITTLRDNCVKGITADKDKLADVVEHSVGPVTALAPHIGYAKASKIAKQALKTGTPVRTLVLEEGLMSEEDLDKVLNLYEMTEPGVMAEELLKKDE